MDKLTEADLKRFTGDVIRYQHSTFRHVIYTPGIRYLVENAKAYWLIDAITSHIYSPQMGNAMACDERLAQMQFWRLSVNADKSGVLVCEADSGEEPTIRQCIPFTDFPLQEVSIWAANDGTYWTLYLPSEH